MLGKSVLKAFILLFVFLSLSPLRAQFLDEKNKEEAKQLTEKVKSLSTESERVQYLISYIKDKNSPIPEYAVGLLGALKSKEAAPFLNGVLTSRDERYNRVKEFIPQVLVEIKDKSSLEPLIEALGDKNLVVAKRSAIALTMLTRHNPGVKFEAFEENQEEAINLWRNWWQKNKEVVNINEEQKTQKEKSAKTSKETGQEENN